jgi:LmbE family N-acetylglucosaminyl deacetylase
MADVVGGSSMRRPADPAAGRRSQRPALTRDVSRVLAVIAHPDDESFGLGALLDRFTSCGIEATVLCFTHGEASTLRNRPGDLASIRATELRTAATALGIDKVELLAYPDGHLGDVAIDELAHHVQTMIAVVRPSHLLVFDDTGVTGHPDHRRATEAAVAAARASGLPVLAWVIPDHVATVLNDRHGTTFRGLPQAHIDARLSVSRIRQRQAIAAHASQASGNPVLHHRLRLLGDAEHLRLLYTTKDKATPDTAATFPRPHPSHPSG